MLLSFGFKLIKNYVVIEGVKYLCKYAADKGAPIIMTYLRNKRYIR